MRGRGPAFGGRGRDRAGAAPPRDDTLDPRFAARLAAELVGRREPVVVVLDDFRAAAGSGPAEDWPVCSGTRARAAAGGRRPPGPAAAAPPLPAHRRTHRDPHRGPRLRREGDGRAARAARRDAVPEVGAGAAGADRGWAAGLRLAAMSMAGHPGPTPSWPSSRGRRGRGQLPGGGGARRPAAPDAPVAAGDRRPGPDQRGVGRRAGGRRGGGLFAELVERNSFLRPLGHGWYRCHQMFADALRLRLCHEEPGRVTALHRGPPRGSAATGWWTRRCGTRPRRASRRTGRTPAVWSSTGWPSAGSSASPRTASRRGCTSGSRAGRRRGDHPEPEPPLVATALALAHGDERACVEGLRRAVRGGCRARTEMGAPSRGGESLSRGEVPLPPGGASLSLGGVLLPLGRASSSPGARAPGRGRRRRPAHPRRDPPGACAATGPGRRRGRRRRGRVAVRPGRPRTPRRAARTARRRAVRTGGGELRAGRFGAAEAALGAGLAAATAAENGALRRDCLADLAVLETLRGRFRAADAYVAKAERASAGAWSYEDRSYAVLHLARAWTDLARGRLPEVRRALGAAEKALRECADPFALGVHALVSG
ncbi:hypothetical protein NKH77_27540 [Streptomyces sp. M19]